MVRRWSTIVLLWLLGVLAAAQLAKMSTIAPLLRDRFALSLPETGLLISLLEVGGGLFGFAAGLALGRIGCRGSLLSGMILLAAMSVLEAIASAAGLLFAARAIEGIGYLLVVIAAPTAIVAVASDADRPRALALWSCFVPVGVAAGGAVTSVAAGLLAPSGVMLLWAGLLGVATLAAFRVPMGGGSRGPIVLPAPGAWMATFAFGLYTLFVCALTMLLPTFLIEEHGATVGTAGLVTALASLSALPASAIAMVAARSGTPSSRRLIAVAMPSLIATALFAPFVFAGGRTDLIIAGTIAVLAIALSGLVSPMMFARLPVLAGAHAPQDPRIATANGLLTQFGAGGALIGPPLGGWVVRLWGWPALGLAIAAMAIAMLIATIWAERIAAPSERKTA
jgi:MFS family permease